MRHFVVLSDRFPPDVLKEFTQYLSEFGAGWAKYFVGGILVATENERINANDICLKLRDLSLGVDCMVMEIPGPSWSTTPSCGTS
jgi:hypothetical protein